MEAVKPQGPQVSQVRPPQQAPLGPLRAPLENQVTGAVRRAVAAGLPSPALLAREDRAGQRVALRALAVLPAPLQVQAEPEAGPLSVETIFSLGPSNATTETQPPATAVTLRVPLKTATLATENQVFAHPFAAMAKNWATKPVMTATQPLTTGVAQLAKPKRDSTVSALQVYAPQSAAIVLSAAQKPVMTAIPSTTTVVRLSAPKNPVILVQVNPAHVAQPVATV